MQKSASDCYSVSCGLFFRDPLGVRARRLRRFHKAQRLKEPLGENSWRKQKKRPESLFSVIRLGFEPKTPTLKVLCSTD